MYGDQSGQMILKNLEQLSGAYKQALDVAEAHEAQIALAKKPSVMEDAFKKSSLHGAPSAVQTGANIVRAVTLGPGSIWGGLSIMRLLKGPKINDLIFWAALSPQNTQRMVSVLTNPAPGMLAADLAREMDAAGLVESRQPESGPPPLLASHPTPPPKPTSVH